MMKSILWTILAFPISTSSAAPRTWTNAEGKKIEAEILRVTAQEAVLKVGATEHKVPFARLSQEDRKWIATTATLKKNPPHPPRSIFASAAAALHR